MKTKFAFLFAFMLIWGVSQWSFAQEGFNFKGLVADASGNPLANQIITVRITIKQGTTIKWREVHNNVHTDAYGIFSVAMGEGNRVAGVATFDEVDWNNTSMNYSVEVDSGSGYQLLVSNEAFQYMPYAKMATKINGVQDKISIGASDSRKLYVSGPADINNEELAYFKATALDGGYDVLQLDVPSGSTAADGDFIEMRNGYDIMFKINAEGEAYAKKITRSTLANSPDLLPYAWGSVQASGNTIYAGSGNYTITRPSTGEYIIHLTGISNPSYNQFMVLASLELASLTPKFIQSYVSGAGQIKIRIYDDTGTPTSENFNFIIFKK